MSDGLIVFCYKHQGKPITHGCIEFDCSECTMCNECIREGQPHLKNHFSSIVDISSFISFLAH